MAVTVLCVPHSLETFEGLDRAAQTARKGWKSVQRVSEWEKDKDREREGGREGEWKRERRRGGEREKKYRLNFFPLQD